MSLVLLLAAAAVGGLTLQRLAVPGGMIVGAMVGAAAFSLVRGGEVMVPGAVQTLAFIVLGAVIGGGVTRGTLSSLRDALLPAVLAAGLLILAGIGIAYLLQWVGVAPPGAVLATSPGALSALSAAAAERGTGAAEVTLFHTVRIVLVLLSLPALLGLLPSNPG